MEISKTTTYVIRVTHTYQAMIAPGKWGPVEERSNNGTEISLDDSEHVRRYINNYKHRVAEPEKEFVFGREFENIWGYRWNNTGFEVVETIVEVNKYPVNIADWV